MGAMLFDPLIATVRAWAMPAIRRDVPLVPPARGAQGGVLGAAALVLLG